MRFRVLWSTLIKPTIYDQQKQFDNLHDAEVYASALRDLGYKVFIKDLNQVFCAECRQPLDGECVLREEFGYCPHYEDEPPPSAA